MKTIEECIANIQEFANKWKLIFEDKGEVGFGRDCVGLIARGDCYVDYNPTRGNTFEYIEDFYDDRLYEIAPADAYHKHNCIAVLGHEDEAIRQLSDWVDGLNKLGAVVEEYPTGATGMQAMLTGATGYAVKIPKKQVADGEE